MSTSNQTPQKRGIFITFEGGEGAGKSTQIKALKSQLEGQGIDLVITREPGGAPGAEEIRNLLVTGGVDRWTSLSEALLNFAARQEHIIHTIEPALAAGRWMLCDRFVDSTMAYQGYAGGVGRAAIEALSDLVLAKCQPDLTLILDLPVEDGLARALGRMEDHTQAENRFEQKGLTYHRALRDAFLDIAKLEPQRCAVIDARPEPGEVSGAIWKIVHERFFSRTAP